MAALRSTAQRRWSLVCVVNAVGLTSKQSKNLFVSWSKLLLTASLENFPCRKFVSACKIRHRVSKSCFVKFRKPLLCMTANCFKAVTKKRAHLESTVKAVWQFCLIPQPVSYTFRWLRSITRDNWSLTTSKSLCRPWFPGCVLITQDHGTWGPLWVSSAVISAT